MSKRDDELMDRAVETCIEYDQVSPNMFQRTLSVDLDTAIRVYEKLVDLGIVVNSKQSEEYDTLIGDVDKNELKMYYLN